MIRVRHVSFGHDVFRCVFLAMAMYIYLSPFTVYRSTHNYVYYILVWGLLLLLCDLVYKRFSLRMEQVRLLIAILALYVITILVNPVYLEDEVLRFLVTVVYFLVLCPPDIPRTIRSKYFAIFVFSVIFIVPVSFLSISSLWIQVTESIVVMNGRAYFYGGLYYPSFWGFYSGPNVAGMLAFISVALLVIEWTILEKIFSKTGTVTAGKVVIAILLLINLTMLTLAASSAPMLAMIAFAFIFSVFAFSRFFNGKIKSMLIRAAAIGFAAVLVAGATFLSAQPIRVGVAMIQAAIPSEYTRNGFLETTAQQVPLPRLSIPMTAASVPTAMTAPVNTAEEEIENESYQDLVLTGKPNFFDDSGRIFIWRLGFDIIKQQPLFGVSSTMLWSKALELDSNKPEGTEYGYWGLITIYRGGMHNAYVQLAVTNGIPALVLFLVFLVLFAIRNIRLLFLKLCSSSFLPAAAILSLAAAIAIWNFFMAQLFPCGIYHYYASAVVFWSCLSFGETLLKNEEVSYKDE